MSRIAESHRHALRLPLLFADLTGRRALRINSALAPFMRPAKLLTALRGAAAVRDTDSAAFLERIGTDENLVRRPAAGLPSLKDYVRAMT